MNGKSKFIIVLLFISLIEQPSHADTNSLQGIWSSISSPFKTLFSSSFWRQLGRSFGASPTDYAYSFKVYNDTDDTVWVGMQRIISFMGACFPKANGWSSYPIAPFTTHETLDESYYFELFIKTTPHAYPDKMPYLQHSDVIYQQDLIQLIPENKNSTKTYYLRVFTGKSLTNGVYHYHPSVELIGYTNQQATKPDPNALNIGPSLNSIVVVNSTNNDYDIGFINKPKQPTFSQKECQLFERVPSQSFGLIAPFGTITSLRPCTIGIFDSSSQQLITTANLDSSGFENFSYTLEIYQDPADASIKICQQGITPGNCDMPSGPVRDLTPIQSYFWYQAVQQLPTSSNIIDLPGSVWIVEIDGTDYQIVGYATPGQALSFTVSRPHYLQKKQLYFLYVTESNITNAQQYIKNVLPTLSNNQIIKTYQQQAQELHKEIMRTQGPQAISKTQLTQISSTLLSQAAHGSLGLHQGKIIDPVTGFTGYLVGSDVFLSQGVGNPAIYYMLSPSVSNADFLPTSTIQNLYVQYSTVTAPEGMPVPKPITTIIQSVNTNPTTTLQQSNGPRLKSHGFN